MPAPPGGGRRPPRATRRAGAAARRGAGAPDGASGSCELRVGTPVGGTIGEPRKPSQGFSGLFALFSCAQFSVHSATNSVHFGWLRGRAAASEGFKVR